MDITESGALLGWGVRVGGNDDKIINHPDILDRKCRSVLNIYCSVSILWLKVVCMRGYLFSITRVRATRQRWLLPKVLRLSDRKHLYLMYIQRSVSIILLKLTGGMIHALNEQPRKATLEPMRRDRPWDIRTGISESGQLCAEIPSFYGRLLLHVIGVFVEAGNNMRHLKAHSITR